VRIISGRFRGKVIHAPAQLPVRPTTDYAKTGLFNILQHRFDLSAVSVLDLFCGTGNIGYEFVSRGCRSLTCVDADSRCVRFVRDTLRELDAGESRVLRSDVLRFLAAATPGYDIIFADPPFDWDGKAHIPELVRSRNLLNPGGWLIVEHGSRDRVEGPWPADEVRTYGHCAFSIFRASGPTDVE
jgi:16S rRNA (guanine(966)-N(2))-methyltransferase RsmD